MSDKYTEVMAGKRGALGLWGHVPPTEAIAEARKVILYDLADAQAKLADLDNGDVKVFHQLGPWAMKNRRQVYP